MDQRNVEQIPRERWEAYFNDLDRAYQGWRATVEVLSEDLGDQHIADGVLLQGISYDPRGSEAGAVLVELGGSGAPFDMHHIRNARAVWVAYAQPGGEIDIDVESEDGPTTLISLRQPVTLPAGGQGGASGGVAVRRGPIRQR